MTTFDVATMRNSNVAYLNRMRNQIRMDPPYQRQGEVWSTEKKRLLVDSVLNGFDIPKIYLHEHSTPLETEDGRRIRYSLIDGRQRLEAIWGYLDGDFALAADFVHIETGEASAANKTFKELEQDEDLLAALFTATSLDVVLIKTDDVEMIEEMFSRLNEAVPLNAAEKRNGRGGALRPVVRKMVDEQRFFTANLPFTNTRYRQYDLATKFLYWEHVGGAADAKKRQLDDFWEELRNDETRVKTLAKDVRDVIGKMAVAFENNDRLLASIGIVSVYYLCFSHRLKDGRPLPGRAALAKFDRERQLGSYESEDDLTGFSYRMLEFDRLAQSPNDGHALSFRLKVLDEFLDEQ